MNEGNFKYLSPFIRVARYDHQYTSFKFDRTLWDYELIYLENLVLVVLNNKLEVIYENKIIRDLPDGVINRTNNYLVSRHFEMKGVRCFNNSTLTQIANDKNLCYQYISKANIKIQDTLFNNYSLLSFPLVLKNPLGRGGNEVYLIKNEEELNEKASLYPYYTLQTLLENKISKDLRVYIINNKIKKIKRAAEVAALLA